MVRKVFLVGVGLGNPNTLTVRAREVIEDSDLLIGAPRLLESFAGLSCERRALVRTGEIVTTLRTSDAEQASVLFSGDVGFYSGAAALAAQLADLEGVRIEAVPGISSLVYFCAKLLTPWQDAHLVSAHGRECDPATEVRAHAKTFFLTGGKTKARDVCAALARAGLGDVAVSVGERLSYDDERITHGTAAGLSERDFGDLAVILAENPAAPV